MECAVMIKEKTKIILNVLTGRCSYIIQKLALLQQMWITIRAWKGCLQSQRRNFDSSLGSSYTTLICWPFCYTNANQFSKRKQLHICLKRIAIFVPEKQNSEVLGFSSQFIKLHLNFRISKWICLVWTRSSSSSRWELSFLFGEIKKREKVKNLVVEKPLRKKCWDANYIFNFWTKGAMNRNKWKRIFRLP